MASDPLQPAGLRDVARLARFWLEDHVEDWLVVAVTARRLPSRVSLDERLCILDARDAHYTAVRHGGAHVVEPDRRG